MTADSQQQAANLGIVTEFFKSFSDTCLRLELEDAKVPRALLQEQYWRGKSPELIAAVAGIAKNLRGLSPKDKNLVLESAALDYDGRAEAAGANLDIHAAGIVECTNTWLQPDKVKQLGIAAMELDEFDVSTLAHFTSNTERIGDAGKSGVGQGARARGKTTRRI